MKTLKEFKRMNQNKIVSGVLSGVAYFFEIPVIYVRIIFVSMTILTGIFLPVLVYIACSYLVSQYEQDPENYEGICGNGTKLNNKRKQED